MKRHMAALLSVVALAGSARAGEPAPESPCLGAPPQKGVTIRGPVLHVVDGQTLCVARGFSPEHWVELSLAGAPADSFRGLLQEVAFARDVDCTVVDASHSPALAVCSVAGRDIAQLARKPNVQRRALAWR